MAPAAMLTMWLAWLCACVGGVVQTPNKEGTIAVLDGNLHLEAPDNGRVLVAGVDVAHTAKVVGQSLEELRSELAAERARQREATAGVVRLVCDVATTNGAPLFSSMQHLVGVANDAVAFSVGSEQYIAAAEAGGETTVYRWSNEAAELQTVQHIVPPRGNTQDVTPATAVTHVAANGVVYLVVSYDHRPPVVYSAHSNVFFFAPHKAVILGTAAEAAVKAVGAFVADDEAFVVAAVKTSTVVFKLQASSSDSVSIVDTFAADDISPAAADAFGLGEEEFLAVAQTVDSLSGSSGTKSLLYKRTDSGQPFTYEPVQEFYTPGATSLQHFVIDGVSYLAVANNFNGSTHRDSAVYAWNSVTFRFDLLQHISATEAVDVAFFEAGPRRFLAFAQRSTSSSSQSASPVYEFRGGLFEHVFDLQTNGASSVSPLSVNNNHFVLVTNTHTNSTLFKLHTACS
eukprot:m.154375 g.154375  ORF g.154375 m.154375 type:complete len:457 (+) comp17497_c1_seq1:2425-3795(+)